MASMFCDRFWSTDLWLPKGVTWTDFESPSADIYYPKVQDIHWSLAVGVFLLLLRYIYERWIIVPVALVLGVKDRKRHVTPNPVLERAFTRNKGTISHADVEVLAKKTELSVREIEIWILKRRRKDTPSSMMKFREVSWHFLFYTCSFVYGMYILWHRNWFWEIKYSVIGWPKLHVDGAVYMFYLVELGFYWSLLISSFTDVKRSDFTEQMIHHLLTITLIYLSWVMNYVRYGAIIMVLHDAADYWLAAGKMAKYSKHNTLCEALFVCFILVWLVTRTGLYPFWKCYLISKRHLFIGTKSNWLDSNTSLEDKYIEVVKFIIFDHNLYLETTGFTHKIFVGLLCGLQILHIIWTFLILRIVFQKFTQGSVSDVRSDSESGDEESDEDSTEVIKRASMNGAKPPQDDK